MELIELLAPWVVVVLGWLWWRRRRARPGNGADRQPAIHPPVMRHRTRPHERPPPDESAGLETWLARRSGDSRAGDPKAARTIHDMPPDARAARLAARGRGLWAGLLDRRDVLILETETAGLGERPEVIEVAVLDTTGAVRFEALSMPVGRISAEAAGIHGLTRRRLEADGARPWPEVHAELSPVLSGATVVLAWNAAFDRQVLEQTSARHGFEFGKPRFRDLMADYRNLRGEVRAKGLHSLSAAARREGIGRYEAYRALGDCRAVLAVMRTVVARGKA